MSTETLLKLSIIHAELPTLAAGLGAGAAKALNQSAGLLNLPAATTPTSTPDDLVKPSAHHQSAAEFMGC